MQYRKVFEKKELIKQGYDAAQSKFTDKFVTEVKDKLNYSYTNEPDGFGFEGYLGYDNSYLRDKYRYFTQTTDVKGNATKYTYDGTHQLLLTESNGTNHKEVLKSEHDELKLVKKKETWSYQVVDGQASYGIDAGGTDVKGAYLTKEYSLLNGKEIAKKYAYDFNSGNCTAEIDGRDNRTNYEYDALNRVVGTTRPDKSVKTHSYDEKPYANMKITYTDPEKVPFQYEYDIMGNLLQATVMDNGKWNVLKTIAYDAKGNKTKEINAMPRLK